VPTLTPALTPAPTNTAGQATSTSPAATVTQVSETATPAATGTPLAGCTIEFSDVAPGSTFYMYVQCLACTEILSGYSDGTFRPELSLTRGQLAKIVSNASGFNEPPFGQAFEDVPTDSPFYAYVWRIAYRGIIQGYPCGGPGEPCGAGNLPYFRPGTTASRGQLGAHRVALVVGAGRGDVGRRREVVHDQRDHAERDHRGEQRDAALTAWPTAAPATPELDAKAGGARHVSSIARS
jgi:hypothetical protein